MAHTMKSQSAQNFETDCTYFSFGSIQTASNAALYLAHTTYALISLVSPLLLVGLVLLPVSFIIIL